MTELNIDRIMESIQQASGSPCEPYTGIKNDLTIRIQPEQLTTAIDVLRDEFDCVHLTGITAQQREEQEDLIEVMYHFWHGCGVSLMMKLPSSDPELPSIIQALPGADFYEREVAEMFGVHYTGRDETPPLLLPDEWDQGPAFMQKEDTDG